MKTLKEEILKAEKEGRALGHFNFPNLEIFNAILDASGEIGESVILGTSEGEREFVGTENAIALVRGARESGHRVFINADHHRSLESFREAVDAGYDMAIIDAADKEFEENIEITRQAVEYARANNPEMLVEGELGYIGTSSKLLDEIPEGAEITRERLVKPEQAREFVEKTGVDLLAPAVGNLHGMLKGAKNPALDIERIKEIREAAGVPLVLHGGSGVTDEDFRLAIKAGVSVVHISTEMRVAYREALENKLGNKPDELAPYRYLDEARDAVKEVVINRIELFRGK